MLYLFVSRGSVRVLDSLVDNFWLEKQEATQDKTRVHTSQLAVP